MKKTTKNTKKSTKTAKFIVNYTDVDTPDDLLYEVIVAKVRAGMVITEQDVKTLVMYGAKVSMSYVQAIIDEQEAHTHYINDDDLTRKMLKLINKKIAKKTPWYKRFWNWMTRKNK